MGLRLPPESHLHSLAHIPPFDHSWRDSLLAPNTLDATKSHYNQQTLGLGVPLLSYLKGSQDREGMLHILQTGVVDNLCSFDGHFPAPYTLTYLTFKFVG